MSASQSSLSGWVIGRWAWSRSGGVYLVAVATDGESMSERLRAMRRWNNRQCAHEWLAVRDLPLLHPINLASLRRMK